ncbi:MAG: hypothetical protein CM15mP44_7850 [Candidatus Neomarinimicrobiota bacterium]|nr:MAG: hypothetical protein CM15mP44_7850 [Candidatus Neomarinimicrobiota bacterium]
MRLLKRIINLKITPPVLMLKDPGLKGGQLPKFQEDMPPTEVDNLFVLRRGSSNNIHGMIYRRV